MELPLGEPGLIAVLAALGLAAGVALVPAARAARRCANRWGALGLALVLGGWLSGALGALLACALPGPAPRLLGWCAALALGGLAGLAGGGLGFAGLLQANRPERAAGAWRGGAALVLLGGYGLVALLLLIVATGRALDSLPGRQPLVVTDESRELNWRFTRLPPWQPWDPGAGVVAASGPGIQLGRQRADLGMHLLLLVQADPGRGTGALVDEALADLGTIAAGVEELERRPLVLGGLAGVLLRTRAVVDGAPQHYVHWCCADGERSYQVVMWAPETTVARQTFDAEANLALLWFGPFQPAPPGEPAGGQRSARWGWRFAPSGTAWQAWPQVADEVPAAEAGFRQGDQAGLVLVPLALGELDPPDEGLLLALLAALEVDPHDPELGAPRQVAPGAWEAEWSRAASRGPVRWRARLLRRPGRALLAAAWAAPGADPAALGGVEAVALDPGAEPPALPALRAGERDAQSALLLRLAGWLLEAEDPQQALACLERVEALAPGQLAPLLFRIQAHSDLGRQAEALDLARAARRAFPEAPEPRSWEAWCLRELGRGDEARAAYEALLVRPGGAEEHDLRGYAELLREAGEAARALELCRAAAARGGAGAATWLLKAELEEEQRLYRAALGSLLEAARLAPEDPLVQERLAALRADLGQAGHEAIRAPLPAVPIPDGLLPPLEAAPPAALGAGARYLERVLALSFVPGRELRLTERARVELLDAQGVNAFATWRVSFDPDLEQVWLESLRVLEPDGREAGQGDREGYYVVADTATWEASGQRVLCAPVPALAPGRVLEVVVTRARREAPARLGFLRRVLAAEVPVRRGALVVTGDLAALRCVPSAGVQAREVPGARAWLARDLPAWRWEPDQPPGGCWLPRVEVGDAGASWEEVGREYLVDLAEPLAPSPEAEALARRAVEGVAGHEARVTALCELVRRELTYQAILFGLRAWVPRPAGEVLESRWGDCKDHSLLLVQLLRGAGIEAHLALVSATDPVQPELPAQDQFDHMLVFVPDPQGGPGRFLDATDEHSPPGLPVPARLGDRPALVLDPAGPRLAGIPPCPEGRSTVAVERLARVAPDGALLLEETLRAEGYAAGDLRGFLRGEARDRAGLRLQRELLAVGAPGRVLALEVDGLDDVAAPLVARLRFRPDAPLRRAGEQLVGRLPSPWARWWLERERAPREGPLQLAAPLLYRETLRLEGPAGPVRLEPPALPASGRFLPVRAHEGALEVRRASGEVGASEVEALLGELDAVLRGLEPELALGAR